MKVFLTKDVPGVGQANEVVDVADGFARNYLLPQKKAVRATEGQIKVAQQISQSQARRQEQARSHAQELVDTLSDKQVSFTAKAGETGRMYGSITSADIAERIGSMLGEEFDRRWLVMERPIHDVGEHTVDLKLEGGVRGHIKVIVEPEEG